MLQSRASTEAEAMRSLAIGIRGRDEEAAKKVLDALTHDSIPLAGKEYGLENKHEKSEKRKVNVEIDESTLPEGISAEDAKKQVEEAYERAGALFDHDAPGGDGVGGVFFAKRDDTIRVKFGDVEDGAEQAFVRQGDGTALVTLSNKRIDIGSEAGAPPEAWKIDRANQLLSKTGVRAAQTAPALGDKNILGESVNGKGTGLPPWVEAGMVEHQSTYGMGKEQVMAGHDVRGFDGLPDKELDIRRDAQGASNVLQWIKETREPNIMSTIVDSGHNGTYSDEIILNAAGVGSMNELYELYDKGRPDGSARAPGERFSDGSSLNLRGHEAAPR